jgi:hypothetical protein
MDIRVIGLGVITLVSVTMKVFPVILERRCGAVSGATC